MVVLSGLLGSDIRGGDRETAVCGRGVVCGGDTVEDLLVIMDMGI